MMPDRRRPARRRSDKPVKRTLDARRDTLDFRDRMFEPTLIEVPPRIDLEAYRKWKVPILDQGTEGACTGFGLATVANYLLRRRAVEPDTVQVSPRMLYDLARRYDEWPGENYDGSSARGAMKGWHKHGVCSDKVWPYSAGRRQRDGGLTEPRAADALKRPLGAYLRVNHKDLVAMHAAISEVGVLYATATVHEGWDAVGDDGIIRATKTLLGGHAFAIVAYDRVGFWIQNSWGADWGRNGFAHVSYDDWLENGTDVWVARLGVPVELHAAESTATVRSVAAGASEGYSFRDLRPHIVSLGNDGRLRPNGTYGTTEADVANIFDNDFPRITKGWKKKRILLYAHGGLVGENTAIQRLADYRAPLLEAEVYPVSFIWHTDFWSTLTNMLEDAVRQRRPEGILDATKDFMLDRLDDALEPILRNLLTKVAWDEMKENAVLATASRAGGARLALTHLTRLARQDKSLEIHVAGHSAGSIFHGPVVELLTTKGTIAGGPLDGARGFGIPIRTCSLWAPACTVDFFKRHYMPAVRSRALDRFALFTLTDKAEQDDHCAHIYNKSLLYLVSNALEEKPRIPLFRDGEPILGMEKWVRKDPRVLGLFEGKDKVADWVLTPNTMAEGSPQASTARQHGAFDDDRPTLQASLARVLDASTAPASFTFSRSAASLAQRRLSLK